MALSSVKITGNSVIPAGILASGFSSALRRRRDSLRRVVDKALEDGVIGLQELSRIRSRDESFSLAQDEVVEIIEQEEVSAPCPHCGKPLRLAVGDPSD